MSVDFGPLNFSNGNFFYLLNEVCGIEVDYCGVLEPMKVLAAIQRAERGLSTQPKEFERPTTVQGNITSCGVDQEYIRQRLRQIREVAEAAIKAGKQIHYG